MEIVYLRERSDVWGKYPNPKAEGPLGSLTQYSAVRARPRRESPEAVKLNDSGMHPGLDRVCVPISQTGETLQDGGRWTECSEGCHNSGAKLAPIKAALDLP